MRIDVHSHLIFLDYLKYLAGRSSLPTGVLEGGTYFVSCNGGYRHASPLVHADVDAKLRAMEDLALACRSSATGFPAPSYWGEMRPTTGLPALTTI